MFVDPPLSTATDPVFGCAVAKAPTRSAKKRDDQRLEIRTRQTPPPGMVRTVDTTWGVVVASAVTGTLTLLGTAVPKIADAFRDRGARKARLDKAQTDAISKLRRLYLASFEYLDRARESTWVPIVAAAADCIPYTEPDSERRAILIEIISHQRVAIDRFVTAFPSR